MSCARCGCTVLRSSLAYGAGLCAVPLAAVLRIPAIGSQLLRDHIGRVYYSDICMIVTTQVGRSV